VEICVLAVRDDEHDREHTVGDDEVMSSDVTEGGTVRERAGKSHKGQGIHTGEPGNNLGVIATEPDFRRAGNSWK
jgi:hypothetical protein